MRNKTKVLSLMLVSVLIFLFFAPLVFSVYIIPERRKSYSGSGNYGDFIAAILTYEIPFPYMVAEKGDIGAVTVDIPWILVAMAFALMLPVVVFSSRLLPFFKGDEYRRARGVFYVALTAMIFFVTPFVNWLVILVTTIGWYWIIFGWVASFVGLCVAFFVFFRHSEIQSAAGASGAVRDWFSNFGSGLRKTARREGRDFAGENRNTNTLENVFESDAETDKEEINLIRQCLSALEKLPEILHNTGMTGKEKREQLSNILNGLLERLERLEALFKQEGRLDKEEERLLRRLYEEEKREIRENDYAQKGLEKFSSLKNRIESNSELRNNGEIQSLLKQIEAKIAQLTQEERNEDTINEAEFEMIKKLVHEEKTDSVNTELNLVKKLLANIKTLRGKKLKEADLNYFVSNSRYFLKELLSLEERDYRMTEEEVQRIRELINRTLRKERGTDRQIATNTQSLLRMINDLEQKIANAEVKREKKEL